MTERHGGHLAPLGARAAARLCSGFLLTLLWGAPVWAQTDTSLGHPPNGRDVKSLEFSGLTGELSGGYAKRYRSGDIVRIVVTDVNPFLYRYAITTRDSQVVIEPSPITFFNLAFKPLGLTLPTAPAAPQGLLSNDDKNKAISVTGTGPLSLSCQEWRTVHVFLRQGLDNMQNNLAERGGLVDDAAFDLRVKYDQHILPAFSPLSKAGSVQAAALTAAKDLNAYSDSLEVANKSNETATATLAALVEALTRRSGELSDSLSKCADLASILKDTKELAATATKMLTAIRTQRNTTQAAYRLLLTTAQDRASYYAILTLPRFDKATDITIRIARQAVAPSLAAGSSFDPLPSTQPPTPPGGSGGGGNSTAPAPAANSISSTVTSTVTAGTAPPVTKTATNGSGDAGGGGGGGGGGGAATPTILNEQRLHFGDRARFSIGVGAFYTPLRTNQFQAQQRKIVPPIGQPGDTLGYFVAVTDSSRYRIVPAVTLNVAMLPEPVSVLGTEVDLLATVGTAVRSQGAGTDIEYLAAVSPSLFAGRVALHFGLYAGKAQELASGSRLNDRIPTTTVPVISSTRVRLAYGISFRIY